MLQSIKENEKAEEKRKAAEERERAEKEEKARIEAEKKEAERIAAEKAEEEKSEIPTVPTVSEPAPPNEIPAENEEKNPVIDTVIIETPETLTTEETEVTADGEPV